MTFPRQTLLNRTKVAASTLLILGAVGGTLATPAAHADDDPLDFILDFEVDGRGNALDANDLDTHGANDRTDIGSLWSNLGITIEGKDTSAPLGLFNTNCRPVDARNISSQFTDPCGVDWNLGDNDLATGTGSYRRNRRSPKISYDTTPQGNALIFEENPGNGTPDDTGSGGTIVFHFDLMNKLDEAILDKAFFIDDARGTIAIEYEDEKDPWSQAFRIDGENEVKEFMLGAEGETRNATKLSVTFDGSGAIGGLKFRSLKEKPAPVPEPAGLLGLAIAGGFGARTLRKRQSEEG
jgi:hypothetical protein